MTELTPLPSSRARPQGRARYRVTAEDFQVDELGVVADGAGEHLLLLVEKTGTNTEWLAGELARRLALPPGSVGHCGRKDRHAVTRQWFSLPASAAAGLEAIELPGVRLLERALHGRKLRPGMHGGNRFRLRLRDLDDLAALDAALTELAADPRVPNYYGPQRFGHDGANLADARARAAAWQARDAAGQGGGRRGSRGRRRPPRELVFAWGVLRAWLFNRVLAARVADGSWAIPLAGEVLLDGQPSAPLWGRGRSASAAAAAAVETAALADCPTECAFLEHSGQQQDRRACVLPVSGLHWEREADGLTLGFDLPPGGYATAVLHELVDAVDAASRADEAAA